MIFSKSITKRNFISFADRCAYGFLMALVVAIPISPALTEILAASLLVSWLITQFSSEYWNVWKKLPAWLWGVFFLLLLWILGVGVLSAYPGTSLTHGLTKWGEKMLLVIASCGTLSSPQRIQRFLSVMLLVSFLIVLDGFWQYFFVNDFLRGKTMSYGVYPTASLRNYTHYACYLMVFFLIGVGANLRRNLLTNERIVWIFHNALFLIALVLSFSRGAWLGAVVGFTGLCLSCEKKTLLIGGAALLSIFLLSTFPLTFRFVWPLPSDWAGYRINIWQASLEMIKDHPWRGVGISNFSKEIIHYYAPGGYAHNSFLQFAAETGIPGLLLFLFWIGGVLWHCFSRLKREAGRFTTLGFVLFFGLVGFLTHSFFDNFFYNTSLGTLFWVLLGSLIGFVNANQISPIEENLTVPNCSR